jgi:hypothetical protein
MSIAIRAREEHVGESAMLKSILMLILGASLAGGARSQTQTFAEVVITHIQQFVSTPVGNVVVQDIDTDLRFRTDGDSEGGGGFLVNVDGLRVGEATVFVYDYTMTLSTRGQAYDGPRDEYCTYLAFKTECFPSYGREGVFARLIVGAIDPRLANPFLDYTQTDARLLLYGNEPERQVQSGQLTASISTTSDFERAGSFSVIVFLNAFAAPIPEPSTLASMVFGLAVLAAAIAWRRPRELRAVSHR